MPCKFLCCCCVPLAGQNQRLAGTQATQLVVSSEEFSTRVTCTAENQTFYTRSKYRRHPPMMLWHRVRFESDSSDDEMHWRHCGTPCSVAPNKAEPVIGYFRISKYERMAQERNKDPNSGIARDYFIGPYNWIWRYRLLFSSSSCRRVAGVPDSST